MDTETVKGIGTLDLFFQKCSKCQHLTIHGFYHQFRWKKDGNRVRPVVSCENCGEPWSKWFALEPAPPALAEDDSDYAYWHEKHVAHLHEKIAAPPPPAAAATGQGG